MLMHWPQSSRGKELRPEGGNSAALGWSPESRSFPRKKPLRNSHQSVSELEGAEAFTHCGVMLGAPR